MRRGQKRREEIVSEFDLESVRPYKTHQSEIETFVFGIENSRENTLWVLEGKKKLALVSERMIAEDNGVYTQHTHTHGRRSRAFKFAKAFMQRQRQGLSYYLVGLWFHVILTCLLFTYARFVRYRCLGPIRCILLHVQLKNQKSFLNFSQEYLILILFSHVSVLKPLGSRLESKLIPDTFKWKIIIETS